MIELVGLAALVSIVVIAFVVSIRLGMLVGPRIDRLTAHDEEEPGDDRAG